MGRFRENERVRTTRTAGQIFAQKTLPEDLARMPLIGRIVGSENPAGLSQVDVLWRVRFDDLGTEALVEDGDLMPLDHHPDNHESS